MSVWYSVSRVCKCGTGHHYFNRLRQKPNGSPSRKRPVCIEDTRQPQNRTYLNLRYSV